VPQRAGQPQAAAAAQRCSELGASSRVEAAVPDLATRRCRSDQVGAMSEPLSQPPRATAQVIGADDGFLVFWFDSHTRLICLAVSLSAVATSEPLEPLEPLQSGVMLGNKMVSYTVPVLLYPISGVPLRSFATCFSAPALCSTLQKTSGVTTTIHCQSRCLA